MDGGTCFVVVNVVVVGERGRLCDCVCVRERPSVLSIMIDDR